MDIFDFVAYRIFSGNGLWQWYEKPGYRVPRSPLGVSNLGGVSNDGKTSQIGSSRLNALVISAKSTGLADVVAASRLRIESSRLFIWSLSRLSSDFTSGPSGSLRSRSDRAARCACWRLWRSSSSCARTSGSGPVCELAQTSRYAWAITSGWRIKDRNWSMTVFSNSRPRKN